MDLLVITATVFAIVKALFGFLNWLLIDSDKIYRKHLDYIWSSLYENSFHNLIFISCQNTIYRLKLLRNKFPFLILLIPFFLTILNYIIIIISFAAIAKSSPNFDFNENDSTIEVAWQLFREIGIFKSQQLIILLIGTSAFSFLTISLSKKTILLIPLVSRMSQLILIICRQIAIIFLGGLTFVIFTFLSFYLYNWRLNTETQQYLYSQFYHISYNFQNSLLFISILTINAIAYALPSFLFLFLFLILLILKLIPNFLKKLILKFIFRLTTDKNPILDQLGNLLGGLGGIIAAILKIIDK